MSTTTRANSKKVITDALLKINFYEEEIAYLEKKGIRSPSALTMAYQKNTLKDLIDEEKFPIGLTLELEKLAEYLNWYRFNHSGDYSDFNETFTTEAYEVFDATRVNMPEKTPTSGSTGSPTIVPDDTEALRVRISDYPRFSGKIPDWYKFYDEFTALGRTQKFKSLLDVNEEPNPEHATLIRDDEEYRTRCHILYAILKRSCAGGLALPFVKQHEKAQDGYLAWRSMYKYYFAKGNLPTYNEEILKQLMNLRLTHNSMGGAEAYISNFMKCLQQLDEAGEPLTETQKRTFSLSQITNDNYKSYKTTCRASKFDFDRCVAELRSEAIEIEKNSRDVKQRSRRSKKCPPREPRRTQIPERKLLLTTALIFDFQLTYGNVFPLNRRNSTRTH